MPGPFRFVNYNWDDKAASTLDPVGRLVYRSNCLGRDQRITNTGGGNTSAKLMEKDPLTGEQVEVLWVKGSGGDLRTADRGLFSSLYQSKLVGLQSVYSKAGNPPAKSPVEDSMVAMYNHCTFNLNPRASSIDTPLHSFVPKKHVDHTHPNAAISIAAAADSEKLTREIYGDDVIWTPWQRPGFDLGLKLQEVCRKHPKAKGVILGQHGLINWADDDKACYELSLELIEKAAAYIEKHDKGDKTFGGQKFAPLDGAARRSLLVELLPWLRGKLVWTNGARSIATIQDDGGVLRFVCSNDAPRLAELGTSCPDHFLRTKIKPLLAEWTPKAGDLDGLKKALESGITQYRQDYAAYYERCKHADSPAMRNPNPSVILIPGVGMVAWGKNKSESRVTAEFYNCAVEVMRGSEAISKYVALPQQEAFDIEYWLLEEAKLKRMPPEKELSGRVAFIVGAGSGIGRVTASRLATEGAHIASVDRDEAGAKETAAQVVKKMGDGIGVAGSGISGCGPAMSFAADMTSRESVRKAIEETILAYGGIDDVVVTAGVFPSPGPDGKLGDNAWNSAFAINVTGAFLVADECAKVLRSQNLPGTVTLTTSVNAVVVKKGSLAYDTSKAAANHLVRELAVELAPLVRVNAVAPATVIEGSSMFPRERVIASLAKYSIAHSADEPTETLVEKLGKFYADRTLLKKTISPGDQAEAVYLLLSSKLAKTTGQVINVDGGLGEGFLR